MPLDTLPYPATLTSDFATTATTNGSSRGTSPQAVALLSRALGDRYALLQIPNHTVRLTHLDTADWRLRRAGIDLLWSSDPQELVASSSGSEPLRQPVGPIRWPALPTDLPDGPVRELVAGPIGIRALIGFATSRAVSAGFDVLNEDHKTVTRVRWWDVRVEAPVETSLRPRIGVERLRGYAAQAADLERRLLSADSVSAPAQNWLDDFWAVAGIGPSQTQRFGMLRDQAADLAVADALLGYLATMEGTVDGIVADVDTEFLHDFRVAVRRTRSVLKLLGDVLPEGTAERIGSEFRWLGDVTTPTRDLDVYLLDFDDLAATVSRPHDLQPLADHLAKQRAAAHRALKRSLRSKRFSDLCRSWRTELGAIISAPTQHALTAAKLADHRLHRTYRKVTKRARAINAASPSEEIHALRKTCKEMRYLLDVFKPLCDPQAYRKVIADFKQLQDILGDFQDGEVQANALHAFAAAMLADQSADANAILAMGELSGRFDARQRAARETLTAHHDEYLGERAAAHVDRLVPAGSRV